MKLESEDGKITLTPTNDDIDRETQSKIRARYSGAEEYKLHRLAIEALMTGNDVPQEYRDYQEFIKNLVEEGEKKKV